MGDGAVRLPPLLVARILRNAVRHPQAYRLSPHGYQLFEAVFVACSAGESNCVSLNSASDNPTFTRSLV